jgi:hypothetical protein
MRVEYVPMPPPQDAESIPVYLHKELQRISTLLGSISEVHNSGMFLVPAGATMSVTTTPSTITAYNRVRQDEEGIESDTSAGTFSFLSTSRYHLTFNANIKHNSGGSTDTEIGVYVNDVLQAGSLRTLNFNGSHYLPVSFAYQGKANRGDVISIKVSMANGSSTLTFNTLDADIEGRLIDV